MFDQSFKTAKIGGLYAAVDLDVVDISSAPNLENVVHFNCVFSMVNFGYVAAQEGSACGGDFGPTI